MFLNITSNSMQFKVVQLQKETEMLDLRQNFTVLIRVIY